MSALAGAQGDGNSPLVVLGGRAPEMRWGSGSLQEIDHLPFVSPLTKSAETVKDTAHIPQFTAAAIDEAPPCHPARRSSTIRSTSSSPRPRPRCRSRRSDRPGPGRSLPGGRRAAGQGRAPRDHGRHRPLLGARGGGAPRPGRGGRNPRLPERHGPRLPPADHELCFSRACGEGLKEADVALVVGVPLDFRSPSAARSGREGKLVSLDVVESEAEGHPSARPGRWSATSRPLWRRSARRPRRPTARAAPTAWVSALRDHEPEKRAAEQSELDDDRAPLHPVRVYRELGRGLDRDAVVIGDGGDFALLRRPVHRDPRARLLDGPRAIRLPRRRPRPQAIGAAKGARPRSPDLPPPR